MINSTDRRIHKLLISILLLLSHSSFGQKNSSDTTTTHNNLEFKYSALIIPTGLIGYGLIGLENDILKFNNSEMQEEILEHIDDKVSIDDFSQYAPALTVYALNAAGIKGKHNFRDRTTILATSYLIMATSVTALKYTTHVIRPDSSSYNSFPSGHTATAFMGAEFLWQEYKDVSIWYGIAGYAVATSTGFFRMYNNRHWLTDVAAGAGIGILSTKIAYWVNPYITKKLFGNNNTTASSIVSPYYNGQQYGVNLSLRF